LARRLAAAQQAAQDASATDPVESVRVVLTGDGRIAAVEVASRWRDRVAADELGGAVIAAYEEAGRCQLETWADTIAHAPEPSAGDDESAVVDDAPGVADPGADPTSPEAVEYARGLYYVLHDVSERLDELAAEAQDRATRTTVGQDRGRHVTVTLTGQTLTTVDADRRWLQDCPPQQISRAITDAVRAAYTAAEEASASSLAHRWPFDDLDRLTSDPAQLFARLGLPVPRSWQERT
jgi:DNA-binding protein YbaB